MTTTNPSADYFEKVAGQWDESADPVISPKPCAGRHRRRPICIPDMIVADVGAGTGFVTAGLAPLVKQVHVLDGSPAMLKLAREKLSAFQNLVFQEADGLALAPT